jgi:hypothetical protein
LSRKGIPISFDSFPSGRRAVIVGNPFVDKTGDSLFDAYAWTVAQHSLPGLVGRRAVTGVDASYFVVDSLLAKAELADRSAS